MANLEEAFLEAIRESPCDLTVRLIFMDWLEERGDLRGELLRLLHMLTQEIDVPNRPVLETRLRELLASGVEPVGPFWTNSIGMEFACIPPGRFLMGSPTDEPERKYDEIQHPVNLTKGFFMGVHLVRQRHWETLMGNNPSKFKGGNRPVERVLWDDCQEFVKKLSVQDDKPYRLPTEAEWEYACRAGTTTPFYFGSMITTKLANYDGNYPYNNGPKGTCRQKTTGVGSFPPNGWGLHDMHGNVWEWCVNHYGPYEVLQETELVRTLKHSEGSRVLRGGSWSGRAKLCRAACRYFDRLGNRNDFVGFRVAFRVD